MRRTHPSAVVIAVIVGLAVGYLLDLAVVSSGGKAIVPPISLSITLVGVAVLVVALAWPIRRAVKEHSTKHLDPFRAMRIAVLAKASSLSGALLFGLALGITLFLLTRTVLPSTSTVWLAVASAIGAVLLLVGGLVAEYFCTLPPDDTDTEKEEHAHA
ncbi:DUF3180 domain-containing protein [Agromyces salentinus]|uniref:DUF3180 domain-containing protein n=1 Tax=Agromyces salentinus TaxID=269421 RepID=A0ABN2MPX7_9MICO|nr:DUF3180 domain-containing protein [Agromyces salentinus]